MRTRAAWETTIAILALFFVDGARAQIDNETVTITDGFQAFPGYDLQFAIDTGDDRFISDYASRGGGPSTYIEFDFGKPYVFTEIVLTDRVTSGGPNFAWFGGLFDYNTAYNYVFSVDPDFTNGDGATDDIVIFVEPVPPEFSPVPPEKIELLQTFTEVPEICAQYLRWEVVSTNGNNPGAADFEFFAEEEGDHETRFVRGDANSDGRIDLTDGIVILRFLFLGDSPPQCLDAANATDSGGPLSLTDAIAIFNWNFFAGILPPPKPQMAIYLADNCGPDPTFDELDCQTPGLVCSE